MRKIPQVPKEVRVNLGLPVASLTVKQKILLVITNLIIMFIAWYVTRPNKPTESPKIEQVYTCIQKDSLKLKTFYEDSSCKIYGDSLNNALTLQETLKLWHSRPRKTPESLMLAKASIESNFRPYIYRFEKQLTYLKTDSLKITDIGMFQVLGIGIPHITNIHTFHVEEQMYVFDSMMSACLLRANNDIKQAVFYYNTPFLQYYPNHNSEKTYKVYKQYEARRHKNS